MSPITSLWGFLWGLVWPNFNPIQDFMVVHVTCKNKEDPIKHKGARVVTTLFIDLSDAQGQLTPKSVMESCRNSNLSKLLLLSLLPAKMKKIYPKIKALEWSQHFFHYKSMGFFPRHSMAANSSVRGWILMNFEPIQDFMVVLVTCKYKEEPIKNEGARVVTRFSPLQEGQKALNR